MFSEHEALAHYNVSLLDTETPGIILSANTRTNITHPAFLHLKH